jgi:putative transposase
MPARVINPLLFLIAKATHSKLAKQLEYLKTENKVLRLRAPKNLRTTKQERRRLLKAGRKLGSDLRHLITIVAYTTFLRWQKEEKKTIGKRRKQGRPQFSMQIRELIIRMARENDWGLGRIQGELKTLGIKISRATIKKILQEEGIDPCPEEPRGNWVQFFKRHAETIWACDFISTRLLTKTGYATGFILFYINLQTRRIHLGGVTTCPSAEWMGQQARNLCIELEEEKPIYLLHDRDGKFTPQYCRILEDCDHIPIKLPCKSPNLNAFAERWVRSIRNECLNHFLIFGENHLRHLVEEYTRYYNEVRPHQGIGNRRIGMNTDPPLQKSISSVRTKTWLGGLLKNYSRQAA